MSHQRLGQQNYPMIKKTTVTRTMQMQDTKRLTELQLR